MYLWKHCCYEFNHMCYKALPSGSYSDGFDRNHNYTLNQDAVTKSYSIGS